MITPCSASWFQQESAWVPEFPTPLSVVHRRLNIPTGVEFVLGQVALKLDFLVVRMSRQFTPG